MPLTGFQEATAAITTWDDWCATWSARAAIHEGMGLPALADGYTLWAAHHDRLKACILLTGPFNWAETLDQAKRIADGASGPVTFLPLEDAGHVANNRTYRYRLQSVDWLADILCGATA